MKVTALSTHCLNADPRRLRNKTGVSIGVFFITLAIAFGGGILIGTITADISSRCF